LIEGGEGARDEGEVGEGGCWIECSELDLSVSDRKEEDNFFSIITKRENENEEKRTLTKPQSTTYLMPSIVTLASAMFVLTMTFRVSLGGVSKISCCSSAVKPA
jgi:hypothetical protein